MGEAAQPGGSIGERIAKARLQQAAKRGRTFTQTELGRLVGVAPATVSQWEAGASIPALDTIQRIAAALDVTGGWLAFGEELRAAVQPEAEGARRITDAEIARARAARDKEERTRVTKRGKGA